MLLKKCNLLSWIIPPVCCNTCGNTLCVYVISKNKKVDEECRSNEQAAA